MRVVMAAPGTRGDVAPIAGLAKRLQRHGHDVVIVADAPYAAIAEESGGDFAAIPADLRASIAADAGDTRSAASPSVIREQLARLRDYMGAAATATLSAADGADVVLAGSVAPFAHDIAEGLGIPSLGTFLQPAEPSAAYPPMLAGSARSFGGWGNRLLGIVMREMGAPGDAACARMRSELGLPAEHRRVAERRRRRAGMPIIHGISPAVLARPADWRPELTLDGFWWPLSPESWSPPRELTEFLGAGPPPVFIGFGSASASADTVRAAADAVRLAGVRAVIQGAGDWTDRRAQPDGDVLAVGDVPHEWLFARMAAAVHHAGAGTTAAGLRAGLPTVTVPQFTDQPFWARRVAALGAGPAPIPAKSLTGERLAGAIGEALAKPGYRECAAAIAAQLTKDDGGAGVVAELQRLSEARSG